MNRFVLDCSVTIAWFALDEQNEYTTTVFKKLIEGDQAIVPNLWALEVCNVLLSKIRRKTAPFSQALEFLEDLSTLNIVTLKNTEDRVFGTVFPLAHDGGLTSYDAVYLDLAMAEGIPIATQDKKLQQAASSLGVPIYLMHGNA